MKKKKIIIIAVIAVVLVVAGVVAGMLIKKYNDEKTRKMDEFVTLDAGKIKSMVIMNGANGKTVEVVAEEYDAVIAMLNEITLPGVFKNEEGYIYPILYRLTITDDKDKEVVIDFAFSKCDVNRKAYNLEPFGKANDVLGKVYRKSGGEV
ncbi:MAG: hypothetical protein IJB96_02225 [Lachnospira sp.]|nr:hypothetical protein [Lachnospira sp.]